MPGLLGQDRVDELNAQIDSLAADPATRARTEAILEPESEALRSLFEVHELDGPVGALAGDPLLADVARALPDRDVSVPQSRINLHPGYQIGTASCRARVCQTV